MEGWHKTMVLVGLPLAVPIGLWREENCSAGGGGHERPFSKPPPLLGRRAGTIVTNCQRGGGVLLFKGTMTPGHFRLPCSAPPRPNRALPHWFFVSGRYGPKHWGDPSLRLSSDRVVVQPPEAAWVGGSNPGRVNFRPPPPPTVSRPGFEPPTKNFPSAALPFDQQLCADIVRPHCLEASEQKLLTPHPTSIPPTPLKKVISSA